LPKNFATKLSQKIEQITNEKKETIIMGDLNSNYLDKSNQKETKEIFNINGFTQLLKSPTRITENTSTPSVIVKILLLA